MSTGDTAERASVYLALAGVDDPEYPDVSIVDLGLVESVDVDADGHVIVGLIPTFSGCPALHVICEDVKSAVAQIPTVTGVDVVWLHTPVWTSDRISPSGVAQLAQGFTVAVALGDQAPACPRCGNTLRQTSLFGPSRCRSVHRCDACRETVEAVRGSAMEDSA